MIVSYKDYFCSCQLFFTDFLLILKRHFVLSNEKEKDKILIPLVSSISCFSYNETRNEFQIFRPVKAPNK